MEKGNTIVVKIGGSTLGAHDTSLEDVASLWQAGRRLVVVHGGGATISAWLGRLQTPTEFVRGLRVTDAETLEVVSAVLAGLINTQLVAALTALGAPALGLSGVDGGCLLADYEDAALGYVGRVSRADQRPLEVLLDAGYLPVLAPLALLEPAGPQILNVNADTAAGQIAAALHAERLIFLTDVEGVRGAQGETLRRLDLSQTRDLLRANVIAGGMIPKVEAGLRAAAAGTLALIIDGRAAHNLQAAFAEDPPGTLIQMI
jgi:acetylglutamate kinase